MTVVLRTLRVESNGDGGLSDLTDRVTDEIRETGLNAGTVTVFVKHTTAAVTIIEVEPGLVDDYEQFWDRLAPREVAYKHHLAPGEDNGHAHVRASTLGPSLVVPFVDKCMTLGTWQRVVIMDFDTPPRTREVVLQVMGE